MKTTVSPIQESNFPDSAYETVLGLRFFKEDLPTLLKHLGVGSLLIAPSAPSMLGLQDDPYYREAVEAADIAIADSGLMALCWNFTHPSRRIKRISGYRFLWTLIRSKRLRPLGTSFWVMASDKDTEAGVKWLNSQQGFHLTKNDTYLAPLYKTGYIKDNKLLTILNEKQPPFIIINIGGGTQERLGHFLKQNLTYPATIICTGAALGFMTGRQTYIPNWVDQCYLGWLWRCFGNPKTFVPRYVKGFLFIPLFMRFHEKIPPLKVPMRKKRS